MYSFNECFLKQQVCLLHFWLEELYTLPAEAFVLPDTGWPVLHTTLLLASLLHTQGDFSIDFLWIYLLISLLQALQKLRFFCIKCFVQCCMLFYIISVASCS